MALSPVGDQKAARAVLAFFLDPQGWILVLELPDNRCHCHDCKRQIPSALLFPASGAMSASQIGETVSTPPRQYFYSDTY